MNETTTQTATVALAQVGAGRTAHFTAEATDTLCGRPVSRILDEGVAVRKDKLCKRCSAALEAAAAEEVPAAEGAPEFERQACSAASSVHPGAEGFEPYRTEAAQLIGYTFAVPGSGSPRYGWVTLAGTCAQALEAYRSGAEETLPLAVEDEAWKTRTRTAANASPVAEKVQVEEAPAEEPPAADALDGEPATQGGEALTAGLAQVTAYTAAVEQLYLNGRDNEDRALYVAPADVLDTLPTLRRMPRWNAGEERFTVNKVALILVRDAQGDRVWVRGEADPIRVDAEGAQVDADAPAEPGPVDMVAVLAATRKLRRRREVQRVIDNREAARTWSAPAPVVEEAPAPVVEETVAPVVEEAPAPVVEAPDASADGPEWRTLKGVAAPFQLYGEDHGEWFRPAGDRDRCTGEPLTVTRLWMKGGLRYGEDEMGRTLRLAGAAAKYWVRVTA